MSDSVKKRLCPVLISPVPRRTGQVFLSNGKKNPFTELPPIKPHPCVEEDLLAKELTVILSKPCVLPPMKKSTASPSFFNKNEKFPARQRVNPVIYDETFIELNSSFSTCQSWTDKFD